MLTFPREFACTLFFSGRYSLGFIAQPVRAQILQPPASVSSAFHINASSLWPLILFPGLLIDATGIRILKVNTVPFLFDGWVFQENNSYEQRNSFKKCMCCRLSPHLGKRKELSVTFVVPSENKDGSSVLQLDTCFLHLLFSLNQQQNPPVV